MFSIRSKMAVDSLHREAVLKPTNRTCMMHRRVDDAAWSLGMALAWITHRSEQCVSNIKTAKSAPTKQAIRDLLSALRAAKLIAHGMFEGERIPHPVETAVWSTFEIVIKPTSYPGHMHLPTSGAPVAIARRMGPQQPRLLSATVPAAKVRKLWPAAKPVAAAVWGCQKYLAAEMKRSPDRAPKPKARFLADCRARFPGLGERGFNRAWAAAIDLMGATGWRKPGRRQKSAHLTGAAIST
jgi:hypothetical protein